MRKLEPLFQRQTFEDDVQRTYPRPNIDKIFEASDNIQLTDIAEGERILVKQTDSTYKSFTKIKGTLEEV